MPSKPPDESSTVSLPQVYERMMREHVAPALRTHGFTGSLRTFKYRSGGTSGSIEWQRDARVVRAREPVLRFTANVYYCCGSGRIGELMPAPAGDTWWEIYAGEPTMRVADSVIAAVRCCALPAILAGLEAPDVELDSRMRHAFAFGPSRDPDGSGADLSAWHVRPIGSQHDEAFAWFTSAEPRRRLGAAYIAASVPSDPRSISALLDRLRNDADPVVRKLIASRMLPPLARDQQVRSALQATAANDPHPGVRWAGRYALRLDLASEPCQEASPCWAAPIYDDGHEKRT